MEKIIGLPPVREAEFLQQIVQLARMFHWRVYHPWISVKSPSGFPDLVLLRPPRLIFAELKTGRRKLTWEQTQWIDALGLIHGIEVYIWREADWDKIQEKLT